MCSFECFVSKFGVHAVKRLFFELGRELIPVLEVRALDDRVRLWMLALYPLCRAVVWAMAEHCERSVTCVAR
jgi:hypothetical protein